MSGYVAVILCMLMSTAAGVTCPNLSGGIVCKRAGAGFRYSDGCNGIRCGAGGMSLSTLMICPVASGTEEMKQCYEMEQAVNERLLARQRVTCPKLEMSIVCRGAPSGFRYSDGCNGIICDGSGSGVSTMMNCPSATTREQLDACDGKLKRIIRSMTVTCPLNKTQICEKKTNGYSFSDGCNRISCTSDGPQEITRRSCPESTADNIACKAAKDAVAPKPQSRAYSLASRPACICDNLSSQNVCTSGRNGFTYSDGCNSITCIGRSALTTLMLCDTAEPDSQCCQHWNATLQEKLQNSTTHTVCNTPQEMCTEGNLERSYYDGCNYCFCLAVGRSACTRRACLRYFGTDADFKQECQRRKAGYIKKKE